MEGINVSDALQNTSPVVNSRQWLDTVLQRRCKVAKLRPFQLEVGMHIIEGKDVFCVCATAQGKTMVLQAAAIAADARGENGICLIIVPTKVLVEQQAEVASDRGLRALAINEDTVREAALGKRDLWRELKSGTDVRVAIMTPQMARGKRMQQLLNLPLFAALIRWVSVDEAHLIDQREGVFKNPYMGLSILRVKLPSTTTWIAVTATAPPERATCIAKKLGFKADSYINARYSVNRPNIKYIPRFFEHATTGTQHLDLSFIIPPGIKSANQIIQSAIFAKTIERGFSFMDFLDTLLPPDIPNRLSLIKLYNGLMPSHYRRKLKEDFESGKVRVMIVTDTAAYGFDASNIRRVVTTDLEEDRDFSDPEQKFGRAGRDGLPAEAIAFAPPWVRNLPPGVTPQTKTELEEEEKRNQLPQPMRAWYNYSQEFCPRHVALHYNSEAVPLDPPCRCVVHDSGDSLSDFTHVQTWKEYFERLSAATDAATPRPRADGAFRVLDKAMRESLLHMLERWSHRLWDQIRPCREWDWSFFMPPFVLNALLDKAHLCTDLENLKIIARGWEYFDEYGPILLKFLMETMTGFDTIYEELDPSSESDFATSEGRTLARLTTLPILKALCRENRCKVTGNKEELVGRLVLHFRSINKSLPGRQEIDRIKKSLPPPKHQTVPLSNKINIPDTPPVTAGIKRRHADEQDKENTPI
ncbi:P-loop containing nucleoside triphosphate hydrolase protein [Favolaschia claudopus]|uniref:DNA 3'-5' helicase n=1 Tax=Favolaschia claudopus TaxID=2862362 RepID=A0AAW0A351_9AGAR